MRIAAGVLIIIVSVLNFVSGCTYVVGGGLAGAVGEGLSELAEDEKAKEELEQAKAMAGGIVFFGLFLFVLFGLEIAAGVLLFLAKKPMFIMVVGGLEILAEVVAFFLTTGADFGAVAWLCRALGIAAGVLVIMGARTIEAPGYAGGEPAPEPGPGV